MFDDGCESTFTPHYYVSDTFLVGVLYSAFSDDAPTNHSSDGFEDHMNPKFPGNAGANLGDERIDGENFIQVIPNLVCIRSYILIQRHLQLLMMTI